MQTVERIIKDRGGLDALKLNYIRIENPGYMRLVIEYVGQGPRGLPMVSVAHYSEQNGDAMRDPEIVFEVYQFTAPGADMEWDWLPISIQQDYLGSYDVIVWKDGAQTLTRPKLAKDVLAFSRTWDRNIKAQGFLKAALSAAVKVQS